MLKRRTVLTAKIETGGYGVDASPAATDAVLVEDITAPSSEGLRMVERNPVRNNISPLQPIYAGRLGVVSFSAEIKGSSAAGTSPEVDALLRCCGMAATIVASTSVTYNPASVNQESATLDYFLDGSFYKLTGCRGTYTMALETGNKAMASFTIIGHVSDTTDAEVPIPTYDSTVPAPLISVPFTVGGFAATINALNFDIGAATATNPDISSVDGYGEVRLTAFAPTGTIDPENTLVATNDWYGDFKAGTTQAISLGPIGTTAGNIINVDFPKAIYTDISHADRDDTSTLDLALTFVDDVGDDFCQISFS